MTDGGEVRLGQDGIRIGWVHAGLMIAVLAGYVVLAVVQRAPLSWVASLPVFVGVVTAAVLTLTRFTRDELVLGPDEVVVRSGGQVHRWPWSEVLELGMVRANLVGAYASPGCTVLIRVEGRAFDVPGPNAPQLVTIAAFGPRAHRRIRSSLERMAAEHGIPFDNRGLRMATMPRPDSPLRPARAPRAADRATEGEP